ncbi:UNKNOWN [Stylonychia lemnae]|uniref:Uncharacterized protein n=1 Tax=Stylonychia lemnae TaxID=5949 RepID=A0A078ALP7_STYLE|nr:UNKNOWN [Stylonychia lemnae]|eukprot:CDW83154.1 UNKNOWN [Stylonychia lemnae]
MSDYSNGEESGSCDEEDEDKDSSEELYSEEDEDTEEKDENEDDDPEDDDLYSSDLEEADVSEFNSQLIQNPSEASNLSQLSKQSRSSIKNFTNENKVILNPEQHQLSQKLNLAQFNTLLLKAQRCINSSKQKERDFDNQKYSYHKALGYYKRALKVANTERDKARVYFYTGQAYFALAGVQFESEFRAKYIYL